jgi:hypothetical protein
VRRHEPTQKYTARSLAEGRSKAEIMRRLKRYIARELPGPVPNTAPRQRGKGSFPDRLTSVGASTRSSKAQFKTLKYGPAFPGRFGSLADARAFCQTFCTTTTIHRHKALGPPTPAPVHYGTAADVRAHRQVVLDAAHAATPNDSANHRRHHGCPSRRGSTRQPRHRRYRPRNQPMSHRP